MADFSFRISPNILLGSYATSRLGEYALDYAKRYIVIMDPVLRDTPVHEKLSMSLRSRNVEYYIFDEVPQFATSVHLKRALDLSKKSFIEGIIAIGGAKTISLARAVSALFNESADMYDFIDGKNTSKTEGLPIVCLLTTGFDPFVFTDKIPIYDARSSQLKFIKTPVTNCKLVIVDPYCTTTLTENQLETSNIYTLCLLTEAYLSQKASFFSDMMVEKAVKIMSYVLDGTGTLTITTPKEELSAQAGCMSSLAAATSSTGHATLLSLCCNARYKVSKALTASILFPYIIEECANYKADRIAAIAKLLNICPQETSSDEAAKVFADYIRQRQAKANLPARLKDLSITMDQFALVAEDAGKLELINELPKSMTSDDLFSLIKTAY